MKRFTDEFNSLIIQTGKGIMDHRATVGEIINGYPGGNALNTENGPVELSSGAERQLFRLVGLDVKVVKDFKKHPELQRALALAKLEDSGNADQVVIARGCQQSKSGLPVYQAFLTQDHLPVLNSMVVGSLRETLPETAMIHRANISDRRMMLRIVDESWYHDLGPGGKALTALVVDNDERGGTGLSIRTGITRVACWNYTLDHQPVFHHSSGFLHPNLLNEHISDAVGRLEEVASSVTSRMNELHDVHIEDVQNMLQLMSGEMGLPAYVTNEANEWWEGNGSVPTLFWVVQALAFGVDRLTTGKRVQWARREEVEYQMFHMASDFAETGEMHFHECPKCHRPLNVIEEDGAISAEYSVE